MPVLLFKVLAVLPWDSKSKKSQQARKTRNPCTLCFLLGQNIGHRRAAAMLTFCGEQQGNGSYLRFCQGSMGRLRFGLLSLLCAWVEAVIDLWLLKDFYSLVQKKPMKQKNKVHFTRLGFLKIIISQWFQKSNQNVSPCKRRMHESLGKILLNFSTPSKPQNPFWQLCGEESRTRANFCQFSKLSKMQKKVGFYGGMIIAAFLYLLFPIFQSYGKSSRCLHTHRVQNLAAKSN